MFAEPASYYLRASAVTPDELKRIHCPVILMHGLHDASFTPEEASLALGRQIRHADVYMLAQCAHSVAHERPREFLAAVNSLSDRISDLAEGPSTAAIVAPMGHQTDDQVTDSKEALESGGEHKQGDSG
jgi:hypothetical protein